MVAAQEACDAVLDYAKDLETRLELTVEKLKNYESMQRIIKELDEQVHGDPPPPQQALFAIVSARRRFWSANSGTRYY